MANVAAERGIGTKKLLVVTANALNLLAALYLLIVMFDSSVLGGALPFATGWGVLLLLALLDYVKWWLIGWGLLDVLLLADWARKPKTQPATLLERLYVPLLACGSFIGVAAIVVSLLIQRIFNG